MKILLPLSKRLESNRMKGLFPIDLVYMWVDGNDPVWQAKRNKYVGSSGNQSQEVVGAARWRDNEELRYSLRSVEKYASWINHIYIITDGQHPQWLDTGNPKITIIDHTEIMPEEAMPVFSSSAIESCIYKIPGLSEHFILGNDDTMFTKPTTRQLFFLDDGTPIVRLARFNRQKALRRGNYHGMIRRMQDLIRDDFGKKIYLAPHHNFDAYLRSDYEYCVNNLHSEEWRATSHHRFRSNDDMHRSFVSYYMIASGHAILRKVGRYNNIEGVFNHIKAFLTNRFGNDSHCIHMYYKNYPAKLQKYNPIMICTNDSERAKEEDGPRMKKFLEELFPQKSSFEK